MTRIKGAKTIDKKSLNCRTPAGGRLLRSLQPVRRLKSILTQFPTRPQLRILNFLNLNTAKGSFWTICRYISVFFKLAQNVPQKMPQKIPSHNFFPKLYFPGGITPQKSFWFLSYSQRTGGNHAKFAIPSVHYHNDDGAGGVPASISACSVDVLWTSCGRRRPLYPLLSSSSHPSPRSLSHRHRGPPVWGVPLNVLFVRFPLVPLPRPCALGIFCVAPGFFWVFSSAKTPCFLCALVFFCIAPGHFFSHTHFCDPRPILLCIWFRVPPSH